jgi:uncharacterized protein YdiU (UPF0061 family)
MRWASPTTRALAVIATGEPVYREETLPGAHPDARCRQPPPRRHLRVFRRARRARKARQLADYGIARHDPELANAPDRHAQWLRAVAERDSRRCWHGG